MAVDHYENFPVASVFLPKELRPAVAAIYRFARSADDIADEGQATADERLRQLDDYREELHRIARSEAPHRLEFHTLAKVIQQHALPLDAFFDLLDAFSQDVVKKRYADFAELLDYCRRSANPVGRLILHLYRAASEENLARSNAICTALQLINFWQDIRIDWQKERVYLPQEDLNRFGVGEEQIASARIDQRWRDLLGFESERAMAMLESGAPLALALPGRIGFELRMVVQGGRRILEKISAREGDVFRHRPRLRLWDWPLMFSRALRM
ncbi:MAG TPA: squalene synthase HpnC [Burkholderiales bacterium]|nr:squalene synthase HpnC [Burkholderiales bacterium]